MPVARKDRPPRVRLSAEIARLGKHFDGRPARLGAVLEQTGGRGWFLALTLLSLPFLLPIPIPMLSTAFGVIIALVGSRLALGQRPWLPAKWMAMELPPGFLQRLIQAAGRIVGFLEHFLRPRLIYVVRPILFRRIVGFMIAVSGFLLLLPLPIPFSNALPAWTVLLLSAGALERDGLFWLLGVAAFAVTILFFTALALGGAAVLDRLLHLVAG
jgi:hypothetical protein